MVGQQVGIGLLVLLMGVALFNDITAAVRLINACKRISVWAAVALAALHPLRMRRRQIRARDARFTVGDIRVEGLQRVSEGTVYNYLPVNIGDELNAQRLREALRALYATGFFRNVELRRDGSTLIVDGAASGRRSRASRSRATRTSRPRS